VVFEPRHVTPRIRAQAGIFTVHNYLDISHPRQFVALETDRQYGDRLKKIVVSADRFATLRWQLLDCGIHDGSLFPDLDGLASRIRTEFVQASDVSNA